MDDVLTLSPYLLLAAVFLPVFPLSMIFTSLFAWARHPLLRVLLLLIWPAAGLFALSEAQENPPPWLIVWALASALLAAWRALGLQDLWQWIAFLATSAWPLLWLAPLPLLPASASSWSQALPWLRELMPPEFLTYATYTPALALSLPLVMLVLAAALVERRFGHVHAAARLALGSRAPRLAAVLVAGILAAAATPLFPNFFLLLALLAKRVAGAPAEMLAVLGIWLLWSWSGPRFIRALVAGEPAPANGLPADSPGDIGAGLAWLLATGFAALAVAGVTLGRGLL